MGKPSKATIAAAASNRRAAKNFELMFHRLRQFVNLTDDAKAYEAFAQQYPDFLPVMFYDSELRDEARERPVGWRVEFHQLFLVFRDLLRDVWKHGDNAELAVLMGTDELAWRVLNRQGEPGFLDRVTMGYQTTIKEAVACIATNYFAVPAKVRPDWRLGAFRYQPDSDFRKAMYGLFRQSWRAKVCPRCEKYFIADKPAQAYCSNKCYGEAKRGRDLGYWRNVGSDRRRERHAKERRS